MKSDESFQLKAISAVEKELKVENIEQLPIKEIEVLIKDKADKVFSKSSGFIKVNELQRQIDFSVIAAGLFCHGEDGAPRWRDVALRTRVLARLRKKDAVQSPSTGRALVRGYFESDACNSIERGSNFGEEVRSVICLNPDNRHLSILFDNTPNDLAALYKGGSFSQFLTKISSGCLNEESEFAMHIWRSAARRYIDDLSRFNIRPDVNEIWSELIGLLFFEDGLRLRELDDCLLILQKFIKMMHGFFRPSFTVDQKGKLLDLSGWIQNDNIRHKSASLHEVEEEIRSLAIDDPNAQPPLIRIFQRR